MSLFGTLRRKGKKLTVEQEKEEIKKNDTTNPIIINSSSSTPNLHKIKPEVKITSASSKEYLDKEDGDDFDVHDDDSSYNSGGSGSTRSFFNFTSSRKRLERKNSSGSNTSNCSASSTSNNSFPFTSSTTLPRLNNKKRPIFTPTSGLRSFVSMVSIRRKNKEFGSSNNLNSTDQKAKRQGGSSIFYSPSLLLSSPNDKITPSSSSLISKDSSIIDKRNSKSVPNIYNLSNKSSLKKIKKHKNMEPGVLSSGSSNNNSGSSSASSNDSESLREDIEDNNINPINNLERDESLIKLCKTPEEIAMDKLMFQGIKKFNTNPKRGIDFLILNEIIQRTPESVAQYLKDGEGLSKSAVGNYLGEHYEFNINVLKAFVNLHDFTDVLLVQALRQFLWSFRLPGEAQKIDRMMECFANRYCQLNPNIFKNSDTCYILSYAIIMLNTSLHNVNVKDKPTVEQFIRMNRDIDGGDALNTNFIVSLYNSIQSEPFQIPPEDGNDLMLTFFNPDIEGWLWKQGERYKRWKRRWFILSNNCLYYFKFTTDKIPRGIIPLENIIVKITNEKTGKQFSFSLHKQIQDSRLTEYIKSCKTLSDGQTVPGRHSSYQLATSSHIERERWMNAISQNSSTHSFYTFLAEKKRNLQVAEKGRKGTILRKDHNKHSNKKSTIIRKSQISIPLTKKMMMKNDDNFEPDLLYPNKFLTNITKSECSSVNDSSENEIEESEQDQSESDLSQISYDVPSPIIQHRFIKSHEEHRVPTLGLGMNSESPINSRKLSFQSPSPSPITQNHVSYNESMINLPEIRVHTSRDGMIGEDYLSESLEKLRILEMSLEEQYPMDDEKRIRELCPKVLKITEGFQQIQEVLDIERSILGDTSAKEKTDKHFSKLQLKPYSVNDDINEDLVTPTPMSVLNNFDTNDKYELFQNQGMNFSRHDSLHKVTIENNSSVRYFPNENILIPKPEQLLENSSSVHVPFETTDEDDSENFKTYEEKTVSSVDIPDNEKLEMTLLEEVINTVVQEKGVNSKIESDFDYSIPSINMTTYNQSGLEIEENSEIFSHIDFSIPILEKNNSIKLKRKKSLEEQIKQIQFKQESIISTGTNDNNNSLINDSSDPLLPPQDSNIIYEISSLRKDSFGFDGTTISKTDTSYEFNNKDEQQQDDSNKSKTISTMNNTDLNSQLPSMDNPSSSITCCEFYNQSPTTATSQSPLSTNVIVEACNSVLINSVRHTDV